MEFFYSGQGKWHRPNSESLPKEAEVVAEELEVADDSYEAISKQWSLSLKEMAQHNANLCFEAGVFNLQSINQLELKYKNETEVQYLLPCYDHKDGVKLDGYTDKDDVRFEIFSSETIKITMEDIVPEDIETETIQNLSPRSERTYLNIIAVLLEFIKGKTKDIEKHPSYVSDAQLIEAIVKDYVELQKKVNIGLSKRTIEGRFTKVNKILEDEVKQAKQTLEDKFEEAKNSLSDSD